MNFNNNNNNNGSNNNSWLHRSNNWEKPHVDIGKSHGHSPTIKTPSGIDQYGTISIGGLKDLPAPYGQIK